MGTTDDAKRDQIAALLAEVRRLDKPADAARRGEVLDELQDAVGMAGRMVMDRDIIRKAEQRLAGG